MTYFQPDDPHHQSFAQADVPVTLPATLYGDDSPVRQPSG